MEEQIGCKIGIKVGFPGIFVVETDDLGSFFRRRRTSKGPFLIIGRERGGLAIDTAFRQSGGHAILWPAHALPHQLWYFRRTQYDGEYLIASVDNGTVLDAGAGSEMGRPLVMWSQHGAPHQRWRLLPTDDRTAYVIESVATGHVLDIPPDAGPETKTTPVLWEPHWGTNQQFLVVTPSGGPV